MSAGEGGNSAYGKKPFKRSRSHFADRITADGRDGWPVEAGRYRLVVSRACPWASRAVISRRLLGLEDALSLAVADPIQDDRSWRFTLDPGGSDPVLGIRYLQRGVRRPGDRLPGRGQRARRSWTSPAAGWSPTTTSRSPSTSPPSGRPCTGPGAPDLYPEPLRDEIDEVMAEVYRDVNNGVYRAGFATGQEEYEEAYADVFRRLEPAVRAAGATSRYLVGRHASPRRTSGCSPRWCASTPSTTATSSATAGS